MVKYNITYRRLFFKIISISTITLNIIKLDDIKNVTSRQLKYYITIILLQVQSRK